MPALKPTIATSFYIKPHKLGRSTTNHFLDPRPPTDRTPNITSNPRWRRITPCAHLARNSTTVYLGNNNYDANTKNKYTVINNNKITVIIDTCLLGFLFRGPTSLFSLSSSRNLSGSQKAGVVGKEAFSAGPESDSDSPSFGSGLKMGPDNKAVSDNDDADRLRNAYINGQKNQASSMQKQPPSNRILTLPTVLTLGRVAAVPLLVCTFYVDSWWGRTATTSIFIAASITDWLDGYLARKMRLGTAFGAFLDPVADKLMVAATLVLLCTRPFEVATFGLVPWLLTVPSIAIIGREITMSAVREWAASQNGKLSEAVAVNNLGKWKTATQMTALTILLATRDSSLNAPGILVASGVVLLYISAGLSVWSLAVYMSKIWRLLLK